MKAYVITIMDMPQSIQMAERCIKSYKANATGDCEMFGAYTPKHDPVQIAKDLKIPTAKFQEKYSRFENCLAAFLSHRALWQKCVDDNEEIIIFEHDAIVKSQIPSLNYRGLISLGHPSYGKWNTPRTLGTNPLTSKKYLPGAHAYAIKPRAAEILLHTAVFEAAPTDIYLNINLFPFIQELYPWPVYADDSFPTIQQTEGCLAKHNYNGNYEIL